jgi:phosphatidylserine/phosphatidylglycerophosphate/cardiolipin synthase-like enzyme
VNVVEAWNKLTLSYGPEDTGSPVEHLIEVESRYGGLTVRRWDRSIMAFPDEDGLYPWDERGSVTLDLWQWRDLAAEVEKRIVENTTRPNETRWQLRIGEEPEGEKQARYERESEWEGQRVRHENERMARELVGSFRAAGLDIVPLEEGH